jgi:voltage-gated sodium channel
MVNSDPSPPPSTRGNDLGPNTESTVNYALASDDGWEKKPALGNGQFTQGSNEYGAKFFTTIVENKRFQTFIHFLIVVNCIMMGIATTDLITQNPELESIFDAIDFTFLIIFTIELVFGFGAFGWGLFKSGWLTFDFFVVTLSWFFPALQVIRGFRALRLLTRIPYTRKIMQALHSVLPVMGSIVVLLSVIFYVAAVIFTELFGEMYDEGTLSVDYFGNLGKSLFTLFQVMTGSGWPDIAREVREKYTWAWFPFVLFLVVTMFIVVELTIAALCQSISRMELTGVDSDSAERDGDDDDTFTKNSDQRIFQLEEKVDRMTKETSVAADNASNSKVGMGGEVSDPAPATRARFSKRHSSSVEWYDKLSLSFADSQEKQTTSERSARQIDNSYNCFPEFIQSRCASIATNAFCQKAIVLFIVVNSITMGFATYNFVKGDAFTAAAFNTVDFVFLIIFTVELLIQFGYRGLAFFKSSWLVFDFFVISLSWMLPTVQVTRAFR